MGVSPSGPALFIENSLFRHASTFRCRKMFCVRGGGGDLYNTLQQPRPFLSIILNTQLAFAEKSV